MYVNSKFEIHVSSEKWDAGEVGHPCYFPYKWILFKLNPWIWTTIRSVFKSEYEVRPYFNAVSVDRQFLFLYENCIYCKLQRKLDYYKIYWSEQKNFPINLHTLTYVWPQYWIKIFKRVPLCPTVSHFSPLNLHSHNAFFKQDWESTRFL